MFCCNKISIRFGFFSLLIVVVIRSEKAVAETYTYISTFGKSTECSIFENATQDDVKQVMYEGLSKDGYVDILSFRGKIPGTIGLKIVKKSDLQAPYYYIISDSYENCKNARQIFDRVIEEIDNKVAPDAPPMKKTKGKPIYELICTQVTTKAETSTSCTTRKSCQNLKIKSDDPSMPIALTIPCDRASVTAE